MRILRTKIRGFIATTTVILLASGVLAFSLVAVGAAAFYSDSVFKRELRIQAGLNLQACLDTVAQMNARDYFLEGEVKIPEFGCVANVTKNAGVLRVTATSTLSGINIYGSISSP